MTTNTPITTAGVVILKSGTVLLVKHKEQAGHLTGVYGLPVGRLEEGESIEQTAKRELFEETGLTARTLKQYPNNTYTATIPRKDGTSKTYTMHIFICDDFTEDLQSNSETEPEWVEIEKLHLFDLLPNVEKAVKDVLSIPLTQND